MQTTWKRRAALAGVVAVTLLGCSALVNLQDVPTPIDAAAGDDAHSNVGDAPSDTTEPSDGQASDAPSDASDAGDANEAIDADASTDAAPILCSSDPAYYNFTTDCDGGAPSLPCDNGLAATGVASDFAKALGLCQSATATRWGIVSVEYTKGFSATAATVDGQHGILPKFGSVITPREGSSLGVLSTGFAREFDSLASTDCNGPDGGGTACFRNGVQMYGASTAPPGYPKATPGCGAPATNVNDGIGVTLKIKVPKNAYGFSFDFDFWTSEWPDYVCTTFNDGFVAWLQSAAFPGAGGDLNITFDLSGHPMGVNAGLFDRCTPNTPTGCNNSTNNDAGLSTCVGGPTELTGTGFYDLGKYCGSVQSTGGGATGWLTTTAPVQPGETITLQFVIWDTSDAILDSSILLDNFQWLPAPAPTNTTVRSP